MPGSVHPLSGFRLIRLGSRPSVSTHHLLSYHRVQQINALAQSSSSAGPSASAAQSSQRNWPSCDFISSAHEPHLSQYPLSVAASLVFWTGEICDFSAITSINAGVMSTISLLVMMPVSLPPCMTTNLLIFNCRILVAASVTFAAASMVDAGLVIDLPAFTLLGSRSRAATLLTTSRSVIRPRGLPDLSTTTTQPIPCFFISLVAVSAVSVSLMVMTGLDIRSSTFTSGAPAAVVNESHKWNLLRVLKDFAGPSGSDRQVLSRDA